MLDLIDRADKQARVYCFMSYWTLNRLLDMAIKMFRLILITILMIFKLVFIANLLPQVNDFEALGFKLNKINHSV